MFRCLPRVHNVQGYVYSLLYHTFRVRDRRDTLPWSCVDARVVYPREPQQRAALLRQVREKERAVAVYEPAARERQLNGFP